MDKQGENKNQLGCTVTARSPLNINKCKDGVNMNDLKHSETSPKPKSKKAHLGGGDDSSYNKPERNTDSDDATDQEDNSKFSDDEMKSQQSKTGNCSEPEDSPESDSKTPSKSNVSNSKTPKNKFDNAVFDQKTEKSTVCQKTEKTQLSGTNFLLNKVSIAAILFAVLALVWFSDPYATPPEDSNLLQVFSHEMEKVQSSFPGQRRDLWKRTNIHIKRHLNLTNPMEPVSLFLASGQGAKKTLACLAKHLATAFSTTGTHNSTILNIDGSSKSNQDSDQVKLDIDKELTTGFEGKARAAVIHHFEELPPGSTLIFYRYCDHENSAYKKVLLIFTIMLPVSEINSELSLSEVEEIVQEYIQQRFVLSGRTATFNEMDVDKLSGLWSRISHLILPVAAEQDIERNSCATSA